MKWIKIETAKDLPQPKERVLIVYKYLGGKREVDIAYLSADSSCWKQTSYGKISELVGNRITHWCSLLDLPEESEK